MTRASRAVETAALLARAAAHRLLHGKPKSMLGRGHLGAALAAMCGADVWRCSCGAMAMISADGQLLLHPVTAAPLCPTFTLRARIRRIRLPRAFVIIRPTH